MSQLIRTHVSLCHLYATSLELGYGFRAARAVSAWQRWCPAAVAGYRTKGRG